LEKDKNGEVASEAKWGSNPVSWITKRFNVLQSEFVKEYLFYSTASEGVDLALCVRF